MLTFPKNQVWTQPGGSDMKGDIWSSFNIDTSENEGKVRLGKRLILNTSTTDVAEITSYPASFIKVGSHCYTIAGASSVGYAFYNDGTMTGTFQKDTGGNAPTTVDSTTSDAVYSNNTLYVSAVVGGFPTFHRKVGDLTWGTTIPTTAVGNSSLTNMLCSFKGRTYMSVEQSRIVSINSSNSLVESGPYTLTININEDFTNVITKLLPADDRIFILCLNTTGGRGFIYEWDGNSTDYQFKHVMESAGALAGTTHNGVPYILDVNGNLFSWNGGTFVKLAGLYRVNNKPLYNPLSLVNNRFIHPNGMTVVNNRIQILIDNRNYDSDSTIEETIQSGIYEYDPLFPTKGLIHKQSIAANKATDIVTQYGQVRINGAGALKEMGVYSNASGANGSVFVGSGYYTDAATTKYGVFYEDRNDTLQKSGYLVTPKIYADDGTSYHLPAIKNSWNAIHTLYRKMLNDTDKIVVKYRTTESAPVEAIITWTSTTTFTTTTDISSYWTSGVGGEVEIIQGIGAGKCSHIISIVNNSGTYTVTVDETYLQASGTSKARFQSWKKISVINNQLETYDQSGPGDVTNWIQIKIWALFSGKNEIERIFVVNNNYQPAN